MVGGCRNKDKKTGCFFCSLWGYPQLRWIYLGGTGLPSGYWTFPTFLGVSLPPVEESPDWGSWGWHVSADHYEESSRLHSQFIRSLLSKWMSGWMGYENLHIRSHHGCASGIEYEPRTRTCTRSPCPPPQNGNNNCTWFMKLFEATGVKCFSQFWAHLTWEVVCTHVQWRIERVGGKRGTSGVNWMVCILHERSICNLRIPWDLQCPQVRWRESQNYSSLGHLLSMKLPRFLCGFSPYLLPQPRWGCWLSSSRASGCAESVCFNLSSGNWVWKQKTISMDSKVISLCRGRVMSAFHFLKFSCVFENVFYVRHVCS